MSSQHYTGREESSDSSATSLFFDTWKPRQPLLSTLCWGAIFLGVFALAIIYVLITFLPKWDKFAFVARLDVSPLVYVNVCLAVFGAIVLALTKIVGRTIPLKANIDNQVVQAFRESKILPERLRAGGFKRLIETHRKDGIVYVYFRIQYPGREYVDVLPLSRNIKSAFDHVVDTDLIATTGRHAKKYPITLVLHYRRED